MRKVIAVVPISAGRWVSTDSVGARRQRFFDVTKTWRGLYFLEVVFDWSLLPSNAYGKLMVECHGGPFDICLLTQQEVNERFVVEGSQIHHKRGKVRGLLSSGWFKLPQTEGTSVLWIGGRGKGKVALATLVISVGED